MKLKPQHAQFLANHIVLNLSKSQGIQIAATIENLNRLATNIIKDDIQQESNIENKVRDILEQYQEEIEEGDINEKQLFAMIKKQVAKEQGFLLSYNERYSQLAHKILDEFIEEKCIVCNVPENTVKNIMLQSVQDYMRFQEDAYDVVIAKLKNYNRKLIAGSDEYELVFARLYEEELAKRG
ncbi:DUF507 family protein [Helicobacter muridarum]|uniref:Competence/damage-inducible domain-containing protein n=1 Tax=Helicobacter muridarum TaxID=216 RepID=A0A099TV68_9HELI|nr:DUF507 family protein [Helicobacter muridarum]TLE01315.1 DUF507 family protein [Helicobacter muridarum]STQ87185.1 competence/damage-inducible domain-containing protein [Helicobacter muridarum]